MRFVGLDNDSYFAVVCLCRYASTFRSIWSVCSMVGGAGFAMIWRFAVGALFVPGMALNCLLLLLKVVPVSKVGC